MSLFYELDIPQEEYVAPNTGKWFVPVDTDKTSFGGSLLNDGSAVEKVSVSRGTNDRFYFNTVLGAHLKADMYYKLHGLPYPHKDAWDQAILDNVAKKAKSNVVESQVMEFE